MIGSRTRVTDPAGTSKATVGGKGNSDLTTVSDGHWETFESQGLL